MVAPLVIRSTVPTKPITTPIICCRDENILKATKPKIIVFIGTIEFNIDAMALSISVSANANKKAGKNVPKNPERTIHFMVFFVSFLRLLKPAKKRITPETIILNDPNCNGVRPISAFLININELPHIKERMIK